MARQRERLFASAERGRPEVGHETWHQVDVRAAGRVLPAAGRPVPGHRVPRGAGRQRPSTSTRSAPAASSAGSIVGGADLLGALGAAGLGLPRRGRRRGAPDLRRRGRAGAGARRRRWSSRSRWPPGDAVGGRRRRRRRGEHEAGDGAAGARRRPGAGGAGRGRTPRSRAAPSWCAWSRTPMPARRRAGERVDFSALSGPPVTERRTRPRVAADALTSLRFLVLGYDIDERDARPLLAALAAARGRAAARRPRACWPARSPCCASSPTCARCRATGAARRTRRSRSTRRARRRATRRSTSTLTCAPATPTPRACPSRSGPGCAARWRTTACPT